MNLLYVGVWFSAVVQVLSNSMKATFYDSWGDEISLAYHGGYVNIECTFNECNGMVNLSRMDRGVKKLVGSETCKGKVASFRLDIDETLQIGTYKCDHGSSSVSLLIPYRLCSDPICMARCNDRDKFCFVKENNPALCSQKIESGLCNAHVSDTICPAGSRSLCEAIAGGFYSTTHYRQGAGACSGKADKWLAIHGQTAISYNSAIVLAPGTKFKTAAASPKQCTLKARGSPSQTFAWANHEAALSHSRLGDECQIRKLTCDSATVSILLVIFGGELNISRITSSDGARTVLKCELRPSVPDGFRVSYSWSDGRSTTIGTGDTLNIPSFTSNRYVCKATAEFKMCNPFTRFTHAFEVAWEEAKTVPSTTTPFVPTTTETEVPTTTESGMTDTPPETPGPTETGDTGTTETGETTATTDTGETTGTTETTMTETEGTSETPAESENPGDGHKTSAEGENTDDGHKTDDQTGSKTDPTEAPTRDDETPTEAGALPIENTDGNSKGSSTIPVVFGVLGVFTLVIVLLVVVCVVRKRRGRKQQEVQHALIPSDLKAMALSIKAFNQPKLNEWAEKRMRFAKGLDSADEDHDMHKFDEVAREEEKELKDRKKLVAHVGTLTKGLATRTDTQVVLKELPEVDEGLQRALRQAAGMEPIPDASGVYDLAEMTEMGYENLDKASELDPTSGTVKRPLRESLPINALQDFYGHKMLLCHALPANSCEYYYKVMVQERVGVLVWVGPLYKTVMEKGVEKQVIRIDDYAWKGIGITGFDLELVKKSEKADNEIRILDIVEKKSRARRQVSLIHVKKWSDTEVPEKVDGLADALALIERQQKIRARQGLPAIMVQCGNGVQGSVALTTAYIGRQMLAFRGTVDPMGILQYIRRHRYRAMDQSYLGERPVLIQMAIVGRVLKVVANRVMDKLTGIRNGTLRGSTLTSSERTLDSLSSTSASPAKSMSLLPSTRVMLRDETKKTEEKKRSKGKGARK